MDKRTPMNALQQLIADYLADNPTESYSSIGRRGGMPRQTVQSLATKEHSRQTPHPDTIDRLARGMGMREEQVRAAAGDAAGYRSANAQEVEDAHGRLIIETVTQLDPERLELLARRARLLLAEMREEAEGRS